MDNEKPGALVGQFEIFFDLGNVLPDLNWIDSVRLAFFKFSKDFVLVVMRDVVLAEGILNQGLLGSFRRVVVFERHHDVPGRAEYAKRSWKIRFHFFHGTFLRLESYAIISMASPRN